MEGVACERGRHDPFVMGLMEDFVHFWVVQTAMDPVDEEISERDEEQELEIVVTSKRCIGRGVVKLSVATHFAEEKRCREYCHDGDGD